jgi:membrane associated rhomboid family serine protease
MKYYALVLVAVCVLVFMLQLSYETFTDEFLLYSTDVLSRPWILVTSIFLHGGMEHLMYNMLALGLFGLILESIVGSRRFILIFFATGIIASIGSAFFYEASLGASGAIMGIIGALAVLRPKMMVWAMGVPMPLVVAAGLWAFIDLAGMFYPSQTANAAHLFGLAAGIVIGLKIRGRYFLKPKPKTMVLNEKDIDEWEDEYMK